MDRKPLRRPEGERADPPAGKRLKPSRIQHFTDPTPAVTRCFGSTVAVEGIHDS